MRPDDGGASIGAVVRVFLAWVRLSVVASLCIAPLGCLFGGGLPDEARVLCAADADCADATVCDLAQHLCVPRGTDLRPLAVAAVSFVPAFARAGVVELHLRADRDFPVDSPPEVVFPAGRSLPLSPPQVSGKDAVFFVDVDELAEGLYPVAAVTTTNEAGARASTDVSGVALVVDRTPPVLRNAALIDPPPGAVYADVPPVDTIVAGAIPSEPVVAASLRVGGLASGVEDCTLDGLVRCSLALPGGALTDGFITVELRAMDDAGNEGTASLEARVDTAPPTVVEDSVTVEIETVGRPTPVARSGSVVVIRLVTDEALGADPVLSFDVDGGLVPFALLERVGRRATFIYDGNAPGQPVLLPGTYGLRISLVDVFGHAVDAAPLRPPAPYADGIPFEAGEVCPTPPGISCPDLDGDGFAASSCGGPDENDIDSTSFPGMIEIPGDGVDNDLVGGDAPLDERSGVFVDSEGGDDANAGTRASPLRTLDAAVPLAQTIFLAERATPYELGIAVQDADLIGGLDPLTWTPTGDRSRVDSVTHARLVVALEVTALIASDTIVVRSAVAGLFAPESVRIIDSAVNTVTTDANGRIIATGSRLQTIDQPSGTGASITLRQSRAGFINVKRLSRIVAVNSVIGGGFCNEGCLQLSLFHSLSTGRLTFPLRDVAKVELVGAVLVSPTAPVAAFTTNATTSIRVQASNLYADATGPLITIDEVGKNLEEINACAFAGCLDAGGNLSEAVPADGVVPASSPLRDVSVPLPPFAPAAVVRDIDGDCRYADGASDIGADEG